MCVPRSGFVDERERDALLRGRTRGELELAGDALRELAVDARGFSRRAGRVGRQGLELLVLRLRVLPVLQRECRATVHRRGAGRHCGRDQGEGEYELREMHGRIVS